MLVYGHIPTLYDYTDSDTVFYNASQNFGFVQFELSSVFCLCDIIIKTYIITKPNVMINITTLKRKLEKPFRLLAVIHTYIVNHPRSQKKL